MVHRERSGRNIGRCARCCGKPGHEFFAISKGQVLNGLQSPDRLEGFSALHRKAALTIA
jgi:hypothetical protein